MMNLKSVLEAQFLVFLFLVCPISTFTDVDFHTASVKSSETENATPVEMLLDYNVNPEVIFSMSYNGAGVQLKKSLVSSEFRILVHLVDCTFDPDDYIMVATKNKTFRWDCPNKLADSRSIGIWNQSAVPYGDDTGKASESMFVTDPLQVLDGFQEVTIFPNFTNTRQIGSNAVRATIVANLYRDIIGNENEDTSCPKGLFNCNAYLYINCGQTCCTNQLNYHDFKAVGNARCIPDSLKCNVNPSCGRYSSDELRDLCTPLEFCSCDDISGDYYCGAFSMSSILIMAITPLFIVPLSIGFYVRIRETSVSLITLLDMLTSGVQVVIHFSIAFVYYNGNDRNGLIIQIGEMVSGILCGVHFLLAIWLYPKIKNETDPNQTLLYTRRYLIVNLILMVTYQLGVFFYFTFSFQRNILVDARLWTSILGLVTRLVFLYSVHHYLHKLYWRCRRPSTSLSRAEDYSESG